MKDRGLNKSECAYCYDKLYVDQLVNLEIVEPQTGAAVFRGNLCSECAYYVRGYWLMAEPTFLRYYRPA
jgi:hypothetical protein